MSSDAQCNAFLYGRTPVMAELRRRVEAVAASEVPLLITGETGTGKESLASEVHRLSLRQQGPFVKVNCAAIPSALLEAELFGFERGAFTGAIERRKGKFQLAQTGTMFLDEIGELDLALQPKLLQVLQDGNMSMLGSSADTATDARVICATNRPLDEAVQNGTFRQDLYYRINVVQLHVPPLRERIADLPQLLDHFLKRCAVEFGRSVPKPSAQLMQLLGVYSWPGNIRELENVVKRLVLLGNEDELTHRLEACLQKERDHLSLSESNLSLKEQVRAFAARYERDLILQALRHNRWNRKKTARMLKISYRGLLYKLKELGPDQPVGLQVGD